MGDKTVRLDCARVRESDAAVLVTPVGFDEDVWIPLSAVDEMHFDAKGEGHIVVAEWVAKKKGLA